jgi:hypothetical protein
MSIPGYYPVGKERPPEPLSMEAIMALPEGTVLVLHTHATKDDPFAKKIESIKKKRIPFPIRYNRRGNLGTGVFVSPEKNVDRKSAWDYPITLIGPPTRINKPQQRSVKEEQHRTEAAAGPAYLRDEAIHPTERLIIKSKPIPESKHPLLTKKERRGLKGWTKS